MADPRFFKTPEPKSLQELAEKCGARLSKSADPSYIIKDVAPLNTADENVLSFFDNIKYKEQFLNTKAGACIAAPRFEKDAPNTVQFLISDSPYKSYALAAQLLYPAEQAAGDISEHAHIDQTAKIGKNCSVEPGAVIGPNAEIGEGCRIEANAVIGQGVILGKDCHVGANASISHSLIGDHVRIYPGVRIGQDGFGFAIDPAGHVKVPQLGRVIIEDHVEIGANTAIDRGAGPDTVIGQGTWIDNLVQIGHNVKIGKGCIIVAQVGISGSTTIEDYAVIGGQVGIAGHLHIGKGARVAAQSGVMRDIPPGEEQMGSPALPKRENMRQISALNRLIKKKKSS